MSPSDWILTNLVRLSSQTANGSRRQVLVFRLDNGICRESPYLRAVSRRVQLYAADSASGSRLRLLYGRLRRHERRLLHLVLRRLTRALLRRTRAPHAAQRSLTSARRVVLLLHG